MGRSGIVLIPMPTYVYKFVKTGETIEVQQSFNEATLTSVKHPRSGRQMAVKKVFTPVGVTFRGDGFYKTDSRTSSKKKADSKSESASDSTTTSASSDSSTATTSSSSAEKSASTSKSKQSDAKAAASP
jgi:predicted nucleic acid-binding Zn ribbon protein